MNTLNQKVSIAEKIGYSLGDCSANFVFQMMMIYQTKFYTDVFGLEGAVAGSVMLLARIVDAFVDPTVGILSDRTKSKWGKYRPWVFGQLYLSWCFTFWHFTIRALKTKDL